VFVVDENTKKYQATYRCMDCGAIADVHETWKKS
jgi:DNA-directed RNA polymerase subunit RPC12/RpoP